ncbi:adenylate/guanylate cyclase domain-containing protein [Nocardioides marmoraquaticus]
MSAADAKPAYGSVLLGPAEQRPRRLRVRIQLLLTVLLVSTNLIGAGVVFVLSALVIPGPAATVGTVVSLSIAVPVYIAVAVAIGVVVGTYGALRPLRWATRDEEPTQEQREQALGVPWFLTKVQATLWGIAVVLFTGLALAVQPARALSTAFTVGIASVVVTAIAFLFSEFVLRPIAARALSGGERVRASRLGVRRRTMLFWGLGTGAPVIGLIVVSLLALTGIETDLTRTRLAVIILVLGTVILVFGALVTWLNARAVVAPILAVSEAMQEVERGTLEREVQVYDGSELGQLQAGFNQMVSGLREREHLRDIFGRHVGRDVAEAASRGEVELGGETREVSVLFIDIVGSTTIANEQDPADVVDLLNRFFGVVVSEVAEREGLVNKFIGDAALAVFGAPVEMPDHATRALAAARAMAARLAEEVPEVAAGIGVSTGEAVAGNVGEESRFEYTVIGDAVNAAARLTELAKDAPGKVLVAMASVEAADADEAAHWTRHGSVTLRGRSSETETAVLADAD